MTTSPGADPNLEQLESLVREKIRASATTEEREKLFGLMNYLASLRDIPDLRSALRALKHELDEARTPPLDYAVFLGLCPQRSEAETGAPREPGALWDTLEPLLSNAMSREADPDERRRLKELYEALREILLTGRDVIVGYYGQRMEVKVLSSNVALDQLREGQQVVLNKLRNVVGVRGEQMRGETAEVANVLSPGGTARVLALPETVTEEGGVLRVQWAGGDKFSVNASAELIRTLRRGDIVAIDDRDPKNKRATAKVKPRLHVRAGGSTETVVEISDDLFKSGVEIGDIVRVDMRLQFAFEKLPSFETSSLTLDEVPDVTYEDIGGLDEQIGRIHDAIELPYIYRNLYDEYQVPRPKGILLYGPPGCGKTMIAKAVANSLTQSIRQHLARMAQLTELYIRLRANPADDDALRQYEDEHAENSLLPVEANGRSDLALEAIARELTANEIDLSDPVGELARLRERLRSKEGIRSFFLNVKGPELLTKWVGETEHRIRKIFEQAKSQASFYTPVVIFFDEMEAMFRTRGSGRSSDVETTIVPQFLAEMDGVEVSENVIIIGASNRADMIDPAIMRPGRLDIKIKVDRPNRESAMAIMALYLTPDLPLSDDGLEREPTRRRRELVFKPDAVRQAVNALNLDDKARAALLEALPAKADMRLALEESAALQALCAQNPAVRAAVEGIAAREQLAEDLIAETIRLLFSPTSRMETSVRGVGSNPNDDSRLTFRLADFASGAVLMSIVARAKQKALKRRIMPPPGENVQMGITAADLRAALKEEFNENAEQFVAYWMLENVGVRDMRQGALRPVITLGAVDDDLWGMEKVKPYRQAKRMGAAG